MPPPPPPTLGEIADFLGVPFDSRRELIIRGVTTLSEAGSDQLSFLGNPFYAPQVATSGAGAILIPDDFEGDDQRYIRVKKPHAALARVVARWFASRPMPSGISPQASIAPTARVAASAAIGPFVTIGDDVTIGENAVIFQHVSIEAGAVIGDDTIIYPLASIYERSIIGKRCIIHSGAVIGSDGYGFAQEGGRHMKIPQIGIVRIGDDVEIGANTTIDRAALGETVIGDGTKVDNLVQIGHNVKIGKHCLIISQVGISGSTELGDYVIAAGQAGLAGHLKVGNGAQIGGGSGVFHDVPDGVRVIGTPAIPFREYARRDVLLRRLLRKPR